MRRQIAVGLVALLISSVTISCGMFGEKRN